MLGPEEQGRPLTILPSYAHMYEFRGYDLSQAQVEPAEGVAGSDDQTISYARIRRPDGNIADNVKFVPAPFRIEFAQGGFPNAPSQNIPGTDMTVHTFDFTPPIFRLLALIVGITT